MNKLEINCDTGTGEILPFSSVDIENYLTAQQAENDKILLNSLIPTDDQIGQAEFELKAINFLMEVGLL